MYRLQCICEIVLLTDKLLSDSRSVSSLESYDSDRLTKSLDVPRATSANQNSSNWTDIDNASPSCGLPVSKPGTDKPALVTSDLSSCSPTSKDSLHLRDSSLVSDTTRSELSWQARDSLERGADSGQPACSSISLPASDADAEITSDVDSRLHSHTLPDCDALEDSVMDVWNCISKNSSSVLEGSVVTPSVQGYLSVNMSKSSDTVNDYSGPVKPGLCVSIDSALMSKVVAATVESPSEDFHSIYASNDNSALSLTTTREACLSDSEPAYSFPDSDSTDAWLEFPLSGKSAALSLCVSRRTVWYVDTTERLYCSSLKGPGLSWTAIDQPAEQISCSPSGYILWKVYRGSAYSATGRLAGKFPAVSEWREVARDVAYVAADDSVVW